MLNLLGSLLVLYCWILAAALALGLCLIGRYYQVRYGQKSYYQLFLVPIFFFFVAGVWDAFFANQGNPLLDFVDAWGPNILMLLGGSVLVLLGNALYRMMMGGRR